MTEVTFDDIIIKKNGFLRGPFGGDLKKEIFVPQSNTTYKVYEQGVVLQRNPKIGRYYISKDYFDKKMFRFEVKPKDFLISCSGVNYGAIYQIEKEAEQGVINQALLRIRLDNNIIDDNYFFYLFKHHIVNMIVGKKGDSTIPNFPAVSVIKKLKFNLPDLNLQKNIGNLLKNIDSKIELNNKINFELEQMAKTLCDYWFVQFDFPDNNDEPYKSSGGKMILNKGIKKEIPEGWEVFSLSSLIRESKNGDWGKEVMGDGYTKCFCIRGADINGLNGTESFDPPIRYIDHSHTNRQLNPDDLIIEISGGSPTQSTGRMAHISQDVLNRLENKSVCSNFCKAISLKDSKLSYIISRYWSHLYDSNVFFNYEGKTSGIKNLLFDQLAKDVKIVLPKSSSLVEKYYSFAESIDTQKQNNLAHNKELAGLRDWLLPMLMNGQVKILDK